jgi:hypothetical protein
MCDYEECVAHPIAEGGWVQQKGTDKSSDNRVAYLPLVNDAR